MPTVLEILPDRGIVYMRQSGHLMVADSQKALADYARHPQARPGQQCLVDFSGVTSIERDWTKVMALQAEVAETMLPRTQEMLLIFYAPTPLTLELASVIVNSWDGVPDILPRIAQREDEALAILGLPETRIADLLASV